jgi:hypothetical protein
MDLIPLFDNTKKVVAEQSRLDQKSGKVSQRVHLFPAGECASDPMEGNWTPQDSFGKQWNAKTGEWVSTYI